MIEQYHLEHRAHLLIRLDVVLGQVLDGVHNLRLNIRLGLVPIHVDQQLQRTVYIDIAQSLDDLYDKPRHGIGLEAIYISVGCFYRNGLRRARGSDCLQQRTFQSLVGSRPVVVMRNGVIFQS